MLAGPNGAGKTTASRNLVHDALGITEFVNADGIATGLSAFTPELVLPKLGKLVRVVPSHRQSVEDLRQLRGNPDPGCKRESK